MKHFAIVLVLGALSASASAIWSDNFDSYVTGSQLHGQGGWAGWDNTASAGALTSSAQALSGPNSVAIGLNSDLVQTYSGANSGLWTYTANVFMPSGRSGTTYFIIMNTYTHGGSHVSADWSIELAMAANGAVVDDFRAETARSLNLDRWNEIRVEADLTGNSQNTYINGELLSTGTWSTGTGSAMNIANVDLFANGTGDVYYDDMALVPEPSTVAALAFGALVLLRRRRK